MITREQYEHWKPLIERYEQAEYEDKQREAEQLLDEDDPLYAPEEPCPTCGDIDGMVNPCCPGYDPLHYLNCGYG